MAKQKIKPHIIKLDRRYKHKLEKQFPIDQMIIFGSQVKGTARQWSDIDVCVVSPKFGKNRHSERLMLMGLVDDIDLRLEPHPYSPKDFRDKWDGLAAEIRRTGIPI